MQIKKYHIMRKTILTKKPYKKHKNLISSCTRGVWCLHLNTTFTGVTHESNIPALFHIV